MKLEAAGGLGGLIYSFLTTTLRANQNVTGLTLTIFGAGIANFLGIRGDTEKVKLEGLIALCAANKKTAPAF